MPKPFPARFTSRCPSCGRAIQTGDQIVFGPDRKAVHATHGDAVPVTPAPAPRRRMEHPSPLQQAIFDFLAVPGDNLIVDAKAGCGKTSTAVEAANRLPAARVLFLAFNKKIAEELSDKVPANCRASTFHSVCYAALRQSLSVQPKLDDKKCQNLYWQMADAGAIDERIAKDAFSSVRQLVDLAKGVGMGLLVPDDDATWQELIDHHALDLPLPAEQIIDICRQLLSASDADTTTIDFNDMILWTLRLPGITFPRYDVVFIDEAQDTNGVQRAVLHKMLEAGGRLVAIGDPNQSIYGWRGASSDAMPLIGEEFNCSTLPLSVTYRCARSIVELAQTIVPEITARDGAPDGEVNYLQSIELSEFDAADAILCRTNAPIVSLAYRFLRHRIPCKVLGRDFGKGLIALIDRMRARSIEELQVKLENYRTRELDKAARARRDDLAQQVNDRVDSLLAVIDSVEDSTIAAVKDSINSLFTEDAGTGLITLSTVHKAKGSEWERVFILDPQNMPAKWAKRPWQQQEERNIQYVAWTRAITSLNFIESARIG